MAKAWGGRFQEDTDKRVEQFTESISFDQRLAEVDIRASKAHARMLARVKLLTEDECEQIVSTLEEIRAEIADRQFEMRVELEDIHMHIESALIERIGDVGRKLHTARSRNDQVSTDMRLYIRDAIEEIQELLKNLQQAFIDRAEKDGDLVMPAYTHLQRAQPVMIAHYWTAYCEKLHRDRHRLSDCFERVNICPLGTAALAGTSLPIDRVATAKALQFERLCGNSIDVSSDRDYLIEFVFSLSMISLHLSSWAEEWILWFSNEFGFLKLPDAFTTGSSIMPQKRNPDVLELIRGKTARVVADLQQLMVLVKSLPLAYNRDLQEDKIALFDAHDTVVSCLQLAAAIVESAEMQHNRIKAGLEDGFLDATTFMEYLILKGVPMRSAHGTVGQLVALCESKSCRLADLSLKELKSACDLIEDDVFEILGTENAVAALSSYGSGGKNCVSRQVARWKKKISEPSR